ncbi:MAG: butyrate kinase [Bacillota bacterium]|nr:butyrate kinase [Bacillota bacterium]
MYWLFVINPGSTSTKMGLFRNDHCVSDAVIQHTVEELQQADGVQGQLAFRLSVAEDMLKSDLSGMDLKREDISAFIGRGGLLHPVAGGTYEVNQAMLDDLSTNRYGEHACNLGAQIAASLAWPSGKKAYIVDPPVVDEMNDLARFTGLPLIKRRSAFHALNQKAVARRAALSIGKDYETCNFIVAHLGGGISIAAHERGRVIDVNDALEEGPFSPERTGTLPSLQLLELAAEHGCDLPKLHRMLVGRGGLFAYTGTTDVKKIEALAQGRPDYALLLEAMAYQIAKSVAAMAACLCGQVDGIILTGGLANSQAVTAQIKDRVRFLGPVLEYPGETELEALAEGALRVLRGQEKAFLYEKEVAM